MTEESEPLILGWSFTNGEYSEFIEEVFGDEVLYAGLNYFVLPNAWARIEDNGLNITNDRVRYAIKVAGSIQRYDFTISECDQLAPLVEEVYRLLSEVYEYASGATSYSNPSYLDGPHYVLEYHGEKASLVIEPEGLSANFPIVVAARKVIEEVKLCANTT